jgi:hypothetical protein
MHLYTGLFITAHDAMHGTVSSNPKLNKLIGLENFNRIDIINGCTQFIDTVYMKGPVQTFEGDYILEGRFGNSIRLSGYLHDNKDNGIPYPAFIIRNGENSENKSKKIYDIVDEDINSDGSSIHMTSGEYITPYTPTSANSTRYQFPSEAKGDQIIVNTDRLTLSTKGDDIFLISNRNLSIFANDTVSIDASSIDFTANDGNVRITAQANNDVIIAVEGGKVLLGADNSEGSVDANQMILGNKLISLIDRLIQAINLMTIATPSGPSAPGPIDKATFTGLANELKDCLSSTNYLV